MFSLSKPARASAPPTSGADISATQREMVYTAFKDTVRISGLPAGFVSCQCSHMADSAGVPRLQVNLLMHKWSGQLLRYTLAFQNQMRTCLDRYEPNIDHSAYQWVWQYAPDCGNPYPEMPPHDEWDRKKVEPPPPPAVDLFERRKAPRPPKP